MIIFKKDEKIFIDTNSNDIKINNLILYLDDIIYIEPNVTFEELFNPIIQNWQLYEDTFNSHLNGNKLKPFYDEWNTSISTKDNMFDHLEIYWNELNYSEYIMSNSTHMDITSNLKGKINNNNVDITFIPINKLKKYIIKIDDTLIIKHSENVFNFKNRFTVYDLLGTIFHTISYYGSPYDRDNNLLQILNKNINNINSETIKLNKITKHLLSNDFNFDLLSILKKYNICFDDNDKKDTNIK